MEKLLEKEKGIDSKRASEKGPLLDLLIHDLTEPYRWSPRVQPVCLKRRVALAQGVRYAAKKYETYIYKGVKREQGWIYGFTEPYQIFILYSIFEKEGANDRVDLKKILDSFEFIKKK
jgi:hypothetical protein